jgi:tetratricopeptide (TPR) repeat protein
VSVDLGDGAGLAGDVDELEPLQRRRKSTWMLQWTTFESAVIPAARGDWDDALARIDTAVALNKATGGPLYAGFFLAHAGMFHRLAGDLDAAVDSGERALHRVRGAAHPWWYAATAGLHAATLVEAGRLGEAAAVARRGLAATSPQTARAWRLACLAPLAVAAADADARAEATTLLESVEAPRDAAWVLGSDAYLLVARAWVDEDTDRAASLLEPLLAATTSSWPAVRERVEVALG